MSIISLYNFITFENLITNKLNLQSFLMAIM